MRSAEMVRKKPGPLAGLFLLTLPLPAFDGWKGNMLIYHLPVPGNRSATSLCLMPSLSLIASLSGCPQQSWDSSARAFRVNAQSFFRSRFPFRTLRKRREACDTRRLSARLVDSHVESNQTEKELHDGQRNRHQSGRAERYLPPH